MYKSFIRPTFDYGDIIYEQTYNCSFHQNIESKQDNACLPNTRTISGTSKKRSFFKSYVWNPYYFVIGIRNCVLSTKYSRMTKLDTFSI